jgi:hypothetical protein
VPIESYRLGPWRLEGTGEWNDYSLIDVRCAEATDVPNVGAFRDACGSRAPSFRRWKVPHLDQALNKDIQALVLAGPS